MTEPLPLSRLILAALQRKQHVYLGTVADHVVARRRRLNKAARLSRRINRRTRNGQHL